MCPESTIRIPLIRGGREAWIVPHKSGEGILPMGQQRSYRTQPALGKDGIGGASRETSRLSGCNGPNWDAEVHTADNGLCEFMPDTIAGIRDVTDSS